jgi:hypothetical protein
MALASRAPGAPDGRALACARHRAPSGAPATRTDVRTALRCSYATVLAPLRHQGRERALAPTTAVQRSQRSPRAERRILVPAPWSRSRSDAPDLATDEGPRARRGNGRTAHATRSRPGKRTITAVTTRSSSRAGRHHRRGSDVATCPDRTLWPKIVSSRRHNRIGGRRSGCALGRRRRYRDLLCRGLVN